jgi:hypothetical protein
LSKNSQQSISKFNSLKIDLAQKKGIRQRIEKQLDELKDKITLQQEEVATKKEAQTLLLAFISQRRESAIQSIENTATYALRAICGDDYRVHFLRNEEKKNNAAFKMEIGIESDFNNEKIITGLKDERGGGVTESTSWGLRLAALEWLGYDGPALLDEAFKSVSSDEKIENVAKLLQKYVRTSGRQTIFASHKADVFEEYADHVIRVQKINGISEIST